MAVRGNKSVNSQRKSILWVSSLVLDVYLHKTSRIEILSHLAKRGWDACLIGTRSRNRIQPQDSGIRTVAIPIRNRPPVSSAVYILTLLFFLPLYITRTRPDFIVIEPNEHFFSFLPTHLLYPSRRFKTVLDIRSVPVSRDTEGSRGFLKMFFFDTCVCLAKKRFDGITIITYSMKNEICKAFSIDPNRVGVWSSGASPTIFNVETHFHEASRLRNELGLSGKFIVLYHGVITPNRGLGETVEAVSTIAKENPAIVFFLLGNGAMSVGLKAMVQERMVQENVMIHDGVDYADVPKYIAMCDVGIVPLPDLPYWRHQCPLNLLEYLAMEKPVIVSDIPANREIVQNGKFGIYVSSTKPAEIAKGIIYAYRNIEELKKSGGAARQVVTEKYNWDKVAQSLENYLFSITD